MSALYPQTILSEPGLQGYWRLGEISGTTVADSKGTNNGTLSGGYTLNQTGLINSITGGGDPCILFNGTTGKAALGSITLQAPLTVEAWITWAGALNGAAPFFSNRQVGANQCIYFGMVNGKFYMYVNGQTGTPTTMAKIDDGLAHHVVVTWDGATAHYYIDGVLDSNVLISSAQPVVASAANIANDIMNNDFWNGKIDEVAWYNTMLTADQVLRHYKYGTGVVPEVPDKFDVMINGQGYMFDRTFDDSPYRTPPALYTQTPTFVDRSNISGNYGDNQQDFWMVLSQHDWAGGENQKFIDLTNPTSLTKFYTSSDMEIRTAGQVRINNGRSPLTPSGIDPTASLIGGADGNLYVGAVTNLFKITSSPYASTSLGAHGLGATPRKTGMASDPAGNIYLSTLAAGTVGVRKWDGAAFSTWSASGADVLIYLNNALYGLRQNASCDLVTWSAGGVVSSLFQWKGADGTANATVGSGLVGLAQYGSKLLVIVTDKRGPSLWQYDGTSTTMVAQLPQGSIYGSSASVLGTVYISIAEPIFYPSGQSQIGVIYSYTSGVLTEIWRSPLGADGTPTYSTAPTLSSWGDTVVANVSGGGLRQYIPQTGSWVSICSTTVNGDVIAAAGFGSQGFVGLSLTGAANNVDLYPGSNGVSASGSISSSLFDAGSSLDKYWKSVKVDADIPAGASIDLAYQLNDVNGTYVTFKTGASAGVEYGIGQTSRSISIKVTLNKGSSSGGPILKRIYVRGVPIQNTFKQRQWLLALQGNKRSDPPFYVTLVDGSTHTKDGDDMRADLVSAIAAGPITIADRFGVFTGIIEPSKSEFKEERSEYGRAEYRAQIVVREV